MTEEEHRGTIAGISNRLISALPSSLLLILLLNIAFIGSLFWLLSAQNASREKALLLLLESCSRTIPLEALPHLAPKPSAP